MCALLLVSTAAQAASGGKFVLVIDAGHGAHDVGAMGSFSYEKDINLRVALAFGRLVEQRCQGVRVIYTRKTDVFLSLSERAQVANREKADLFVSVHTNSVEDGHITFGCETYTLTTDKAAFNLGIAKRENRITVYEGRGGKEVGFDPNKTESHIMFEFLQSQNMQQSVDFARLVQKQYARNGRVDKGVKQANLQVLREIAMPGVLTELGFISTPEEERFLNSDVGVKILSTCLYNAFCDYYAAYGHPNARPQQIALSREETARRAPKPVEGEGEAEVVPVETKKKAEEPKQKVDQTPAPEQKKIGTGED